MPRDLTIRPIPAAIFIALSIAVGSPQVEVLSAELEPPTLGGVSFRAELAELADQARADGQNEMAKLISDWCFPRDPGRQYLFRLPVDGDEEAVEDSIVWERFLEVRRRRAAELWRSAEKRLGTGDLEGTWQAVHEILHEDPHDQRARVMLGFEQEEGRWRRKNPLPSVRAGTARHSKYGWPARSYWTAKSPHFQVVTNESQQFALKTAIRLEQFHDIWRQLFARFWLPRNALDRIWNGNGSIGAGRRTFRVVVFRDRDEYVDALKPTEPNIEISTGVYLNAKRTTFLYVRDGDRVDAADPWPTWRHEVTHQVLHQTLRADARVGAKQNFWVVEGIALYMESWQDFDSYVTVGGLDAERLQYARHRALTDQFLVPSAELVAMGREQLQTDPRIRRLYSQASGLAHFLMDGADVNFRGDMLEYLQDVYARRDNLTTLATLTGRSCEELDAAYRQYLDVDDERIERSLINSRAEMLDLSHTAVTDQGLKRVGQMRQLQWLDVSGCRITDEGLAELAKHDQLQELYLRGTLVTDGAISALATIPKLSVLDIAETSVTQDGIRQLTESLPDLKTVE